MIMIPLSLFLSLPIASIPNHGVALPAELRPAREVIKVFATPENNGSITIHSANEMVVSFYLFDVEGKLVYQNNIQKGEKVLVEGLTKGTYLYNAFQNDNNLKGGKITLK